jgi:hypothetical protein
LLALVEPILEDFVGLQLLGSGLVDLPPEELVALDASEEPGFREARERLSHGHEVFINEHSAVIGKWASNPASKMWE